MELASSYNYSSPNRDMWTESLIGTPAWPAATSGKRADMLSSGHGTPWKKKHIRMESEFPKLTCPLTATNHIESHAVALVQYRTRNELGIAALNLHRPELVLFQFTDNQTFSNTMRLLNFFDPQEIILPHSCGTNY